MSDVPDDNFETWPCDSLMKNMIEAQDYVYRHHRAKVLLKLPLVQKLVTEIEKLKKNGAEDPIEIAISVNAPYETDYHEMAYIRAVKAIIERRVRYLKSGKRTWQTKAEHERRGKNAPFAPLDPEQDE